MAEATSTTPEAPEQPSQERLASALRNAHLAGDVAAAKTLANAYKSLYGPKPEPEPPGLMERAGNALSGLVREPGTREQMEPTAELGQAARKIADAGRRGPAPSIDSANDPEPIPGPSGATGTYEAPKPQTGGATGSYQAPIASPARSTPGKPKRKPSSFNAARGAVERTGDLAGGVGTTINTAAEAAEDKFGLGGLVWDGESLVPTYLNAQDYSDFLAEGGSDLGAVATDNLKNIDAGYVPENTWKSVKEEFSEGGALSASAYGEVLAYGFEQGIKSIPDMVAVTLSLPAYVIARSGEIGETRAQNKGKEKAELTDIIEAAPFALGSAILEGIGARGITRAGAEVLGKEALKRGIKAASKRIAAAGGAAAGRESVTEFVQEGILEYLGERFGTDAKLDIAEAFDRGLGGLVAGGTFGGPVGGSVAGGRELARPSQKTELGRALNEEIDNAEFAPADQAVTESLDPSRAQMEQTQAPQRKGMGELLQEAMDRRGVTPEAQGYQPGTEIAPAQNVPFALPVDEQTPEREPTREATAPPSQVDKPLTYTGYNGKERTVRSYQWEGDYRIAQVGNNVYEVIDPNGRAVSQKATLDFAVKDANRLQGREAPPPTGATNEAAGQGQEDLLAQAASDTTKPLAPTEPAQPESFPEGFEPYRANIRGKGETWAVPAVRGQRGVGGDTLHDSLDEALTQAQSNVRQEERQAQTRSEMDEQAQQERQQEDEKQSDLSEIGEILGIPKMRAGRARDTLNNRANFNGREMTLKARIEELVEQGARIEGEGDSRILAFGDDRFLDKKALTKTGIDYAEALIARREQTTLEETTEEATTNEPTELDQPGEGPLERVPADQVQGPEEAGDTGPGAERGSGENVQGDQRTGGRRVPAGRGVSDGAGAVSVPAGRERGANTEPRDEPDARGDGTQPADDGDQQGAVTRGDEAAHEPREKAAEAAPTPKGTTTQPATPSSDRPARMFTITGELGTGGPKAKFKANLAAIQTLKTLQEEGRQATLTEQETLAQYVGWGGLPQAFEGDGGKVSKGWDKEVAQLKEAMTDEEYAAARRSTQDAHYTSVDIVDAMWDGLRIMGFKGGKVLEPSVGTGNFLGLMPGTMRSKSEITAVELDPITGGIAAQLYPAANVQYPVGFQDFAMPDGYFDAAIGNPPFGNQKLYDGKRKNISKFSIHNYFFAKSLEGLKENGVLAMVVSSRLLDSGRSQARDFIAERAEFLAAIRLPNNAFLKNAGTEVTTDLIFLRKLREGETSIDGETWGGVETVTDAKGIEIPLNEYFVRHPEMMLGEWGAYGSMYGPNEPALVAREGQDTNALLAEAIASLPRNIMDSAAAAPVEATYDRATSVENVKVGSMFRDGSDIKMRGEDVMGNTQAEVVTFRNDKARARVEGMIDVRDAATDLRKAQLSEQASDDALQGLRDKLNATYDKFVKANGLISLDANKRLFRQDPTWPQIAALEDKFDKGISAAVAKRTGEAAKPPSAKKAAIFSRRTQQPYHAPEHASSAVDALAASLSEHGRVDMPYMASLYGKTEAKVAEELEGRIFEETPGSWVERDAFLSGNVKHKLSLAERLAKEMPRFQRNVEALREVQPEDIEAVDISVKTGAHWMPVEDMTAFVQFIMDSDSGGASYASPVAKWSIKGNPTPAQRQRWATERVDVNKLIEHAANQTNAVVRDKLDDGSTLVNESATNVAAERIAKINTEFRRWVWADDARRERLARLYNDTFNTDRLREFDGGHLTFPGKVSDDIISLRPHQSNAVWRIVQSGNTLLDQVVGSGKTFAMVAGAMEMRRMGRARKPMFVVPNHLVGQWATDFLKLYPSANILATTKKDFEKGNRKQLFARIATGDWDAVIVAHSAIGKVEMDAKFQEQFIKAQIRDHDAAIKAVRAAEGKKSRSVKQIEKQKERLEEKLKRLFDADNKDDNLTFSELGVDALFLDEAH